jgi:transcriptional regulator GlxA family with amidase domain
MDSFPDNAIDVTKILAEALPDFLSDWSSAKVYLVPDPPSSRDRWPMRVPPIRGGLSAGTLERVRRHIEGQLGNSITLHDLASIAGLSDCHFARAFKQSTGMPPHRYLTNRRVERAIELIRETDRPLAQIALEVGFCDQSHFSRLIARVTGTTPRELRRANFEPTRKEHLPALWPGTGGPTVHRHVVNGADESRATDP